MCVENEEEVEEDNWGGGCIAYWGEFINENARAMGGREIWLTKPKNGDTNEKTKTCNNAYWKTVAVRKPEPVKIVLKRSEGQKKRLIFFLKSAFHGIVRKIEVFFKSLNEKRTDNFT